MAKILVGWDGSDAADGALAFAAGLAREGDEMVVATVIPARLKDRSFLQMLFPDIDLPEPTGGNSYKENASKRLEERLAAVETEASVTGEVRAGDPADELLGMIDEDGFTHLVVGYKSYEAHLPYHVGSIAEKLVRYANVPITVYRPAPSPAD